MTRFVSLLAAVVTVTLSLGFIPSASADQTEPKGQPMMLPVDPAPLVAQTGEGERTFTVEVADDDVERAAGLMFRRSMGDAHGMLFVFDDTRRLAFWMKNTIMPLDLVFIGEDGRVAAILQGEPYSTAPISPAAPVRFVLELKAGTAQKAGIVDGDRIRHPKIDRVADEG